MAIHSFPVADGWRLFATSGPIPDELRSTLLADGVPANVPGLVHTDLLAAGLIPDPYDGANEQATTWIGWCDWTYRTSFAAEPPAPGERLTLVAEGLDTVATVLLNGHEVARTRNQHRSYRWEVGRLIQAGQNTVEVRFGSPNRYARERDAAMGPQHWGDGHPFNAIRKAACNFGWDWGLDVASCGIHRPLRLERWTQVRLAALRPVTYLDAAAQRAGLDPVPHLEVHATIERADDADAGVAIRVAIAGAQATGVIEPGADSTVIRLDVPGAELWWPRGQGEGGPALHDLRVDLLAIDDLAGAPLDSWQRRYGLRSAEVDTRPDEHGTRYVLRVNGKDMYVTGVNWIPDDALYTRVNAESVARSLNDAVEVGANLVRVWGGGFYESEDFYEFCDRAGLMVWQDFLFACSAYAEVAELADEVEAEARENITRLAAHPSLVVFNGNNETFIGYAQWNWRLHLQGRPWGEGYYLDLLPRLVAELAPTTPYTPGSPYSFDRYVDPNAASHGTQHIWDVWNEVDYAQYRQHWSRFASEFGFQAPPAWATLLDAVHDEPMAEDGPQMLVHQKAWDGQGKLRRGWANHLPEPASFEDWHWLTQLNQAHAVRFGVEHLRSIFPINRGAIVWQLNDCWPVVSWSAVDSAGRRKPLFYALRAAFAPRLVTVQPRDGIGCVLAVHNNADEVWRTEARVRRMDFAGNVLASGVVPVEVAARAAAEVRLPAEVMTAGDAAGEVAVAELASGERALWYFAPDKDLALGGNGMAAKAVRAGNAVRVRLTASSLVKDVTILADKVCPDARADRGLVTLLPGESAEIVVDGVPDGVDPAAFTDPRVLRSVNDLLIGA